MVSEKLSAYKQRIETLITAGGISPEVEGLLSDMLADLTEADRSNRALRRAALKAGQTSLMSSRLRDALKE